MEDLTGKAPGSSLSAAEWNQVPQELQNVITSQGLALSNGDLFQLAKAIAKLVAAGDFYTDSGVADAYVLNAIGSTIAPDSYFDGFRVRFLPGNSNTAASTVNVAGIGVKNILNSDFTPLSPNNVLVGVQEELYFDDSKNAFIRTAFIGTDIPAGSAMLFVQSSAPVGWTKSVAHDNKALRVVSGSAGSGGSVDFSDAFKSQSVGGSIGNTTSGGSIVVASHTLAESQLPGHLHQKTYSYVAGGALNQGFVYNNPEAYHGGGDTRSSAGNKTMTTATTGSGGSHSHGGSFFGTPHTHSLAGTVVNLDVNYVDTIIATKD